MEAPVRFPEARYAVIFSSLASADREGYAEADEQTLGLALRWPGMVGYESVNDGSGRSLFISYWTSRAAIASWREDAVHRAAKSKAAQWYQAYHSLIVKIEHQSEYNTEEL